MTSQRKCPIGNYEKLFKNDFDSCQDVVFSCCVKDGPLSRFTRPEQTKMQRLDAQSANCAHIPIFQIFSNKTSRLVLSSELLHFVFLFYFALFVLFVVFIWFLVTLPVQRVGILLSSGCLLYTSPSPRDA